MTDTRISALVLYFDASPEYPPYPTKVTPTVELYQRVVGGYIEAVFGETDDGHQVAFYVNEEGIGQALPVNHVATRLWRRLNPSAHQALLGNAVVVGANECDDADLPHGVANLALALYRDMEIEGYVELLRLDQD